MTTSKTSETAAKKDVAKLQRAIVDGLENVKAQDIQVFDTENLSPLFERVIVASGTSNRQTKAIAASVRDKVKDAGFPKPRTEGEDNGEWIIVDCGAAVAHIMQPTIRQYYRLEDLWGETPVRLKLGAAKPVAPEAKVPAKTAARRAAKAAETTGSAPAKKALARKTTGGRTGAGNTGGPAAKTASRPSAGSAGKPTSRTAGTRTSAGTDGTAKTRASVTNKTTAKAPVKSAAKTPSTAAAKALVKRPVKAPVGAPAKASPVKTLVVKPRRDLTPAKKAASGKAAAPTKRAAPAKSSTAKSPARKAPGRKA